jgi:hypothetical protein
MLVCVSYVDTKGTHLKEDATGSWWLMPIILDTCETEIRWTMVQGLPRQMGPISKITRAKWTGGVVQVIECLLCKSNALSSNPSLAKK